MGVLGEVLTEEDQHAVEPGSQGTEHENPNTGNGQGILSSGLSHW